MAKSLKKLESLIEDGPGPGPGGFKAETANGTAHWRGTGWNDLPPLNSPEVPASPTHPTGRSNRTAE